MWNKLHIKLAKSNKYVTVTSFSLIDAKCNNASFHKTALACTLLVSTAMQLRWCDIFYSISDRNDEIRNQRCCKNKSGTVFWNIVYIHSSCCLLLISLQCCDTVEWQEEHHHHQTCKQLSVGMLVVMTLIRLELCTSYSSSCHQHLSSSLLQ